MKKINTIVFALLLLSVATSLKAQVKVENSSRLGLGISGGLSTMGVNSGADNYAGGAAGLNIVYAHHIGKHWGVMVGLDVGKSKSYLKDVDLYSSVVEYVPFHQDGIPDFERSSHVEYHTPSFSERYDMTYLAIPLEVFIQGGGFGFSIKRFHQSYVALGVELMMPLSLQANGSYEPSTRSLGPDITGAGVQIDEPMLIGYHPARSASYDAKAVMSPSYMLLGLAEIGTMLKHNESGALSIGVYFEYSILSSQFGSDNDLMQNDGSGVILNNGYLASSLADKMRYFQCGVKLQYNFLFGTK
ncbi:MAG: hypothetical protein KBT04_02560 [Bacteroidales bacterium]|nr:hypothetical protein [Candidatus Colimorpha onthohippi]